MKKHEDTGKLSRMNGLLKDARMPFVAAFIKRRSYHGFVLSGQHPQIGICEYLGDDFYLALANLEEFIEKHNC